MGRAKRRIWICSPWITRKDIRKYLRAEDVRIILGFSNKRDIKISDLEFLKSLNEEKNVQVRVNERAHRKIYIFDSCAVVGSSNLTNMGLGRSIRHNLETSIASDEEDVVNGATRHFEKTWNESIPISELQYKVERKKPKMRGIKEILELFRPHNPLERILD